MDNPFADLIPNLASPESEINDLRLSARAHQIIEKCLLEVGRWQNTSVSRMGGNRYREFFGVSTNNADPNQVVDGRVLSQMDQVEELLRSRVTFQSVSQEEIDSVRTELMNIRVRLERQQAKSRYERVQKQVQTGRDEGVRQKVSFSDEKTKIGVLPPSLTSATVYGSTMESMGEPPSNIGNEKVMRELMEIVGRYGGGKKKTTPKQKEEEKKKEKKPSSKKSKKSVGDIPRARIGNIPKASIGAIEEEKDARGRIEEEGPVLVRGRRRPENEVGPVPGAVGIEYERTPPQVPRQRQVERDSNELSIKRQLNDRMRVVQEIVRNQMIGAGLNPDNPPQQPPARRGELVIRNLNETFNELVQEKMNGNLLQEAVVLGPIDLESSEPREKIWGELPLNPVYPKRSALTNFVHRYAEVNDANFPDGEVKRHMSERLETILHIIREDVGFTDDIAFCKSLIIFVGSQAGRALDVDYAIFKFFAMKNEAFSNDHVGLLSRGRNFSDWKVQAIVGINERYPRLKIDINGFHDFLFFRLTSGQLKFAVDLVVISLLDIMDRGENEDDDAFNARKNLVGVAIHAVLSLPMFNPITEAEIPERSLGQTEQVKKLLRDVVMIQEEHLFDQIWTFFFQIVKLFRYFWSSSLKFRTIMLSGERYHKHVIHGQEVKLTQAYPFLISTSFFQKDDNNLITDNIRQDVFDDTWSKVKYFQSEMEETNKLAFYDLTISIRLKTIHDSTMDGDSIYKTLNKADRALYRRGDYRTPDGVQIKPNYEEYHPMFIIDILSAHPEKWDRYVEQERPVHRRYSQEFLSIQVFSELLQNLAYNRDFFKEWIVNSYMRQITEWANKYQLVKCDDEQAGIGDVAPNAQRIDWNYVMVDFISFQAKTNYFDKPRLQANPNVFAGTKLPGPYSLYNQGYLGSTLSKYKNGQTWYSLTNPQKTVGEESEDYFKSGSGTPSGARGTPPRFLDFDFDSPRVFCRTAAGGIIRKLVMFTEVTNIGICLYEAWWTWVHRDDIKHQTSIMVNGQRRNYWKKADRLELIMNDFKALSPEQAMIYIQGEVRQFLQVHGDIPLVYWEDPQLVYNINENTPRDLSAVLLCYNGHICCASVEKLKEVLPKLTDSHDDYHRPDWEEKCEDTGKTYDKQKKYILFPMQLWSTQKKQEIENLSRARKEEGNMEEVKGYEVDNSINYYLDIETSKAEDGKFTPYLICIRGNNESDKIWWGADCMLNWREWLLGKINEDHNLNLRHEKSESPIINIWTYNGFRFDMIFLVMSFVDLPNFELKGTLTSIKSLSIGNIFFRDFQRIVPIGSLIKQSIHWKTETKKSEMDHDAMTTDKMNQMYDNPDSEENIKLQEEVIKYCLIDCQVLKECVEAYLKFVITEFDVSPYVNSTAGLSMTIFRSLHYNAIKKETPVKHSNSSSSENKKKSKKKDTQPDYQKLLQGVPQFLYDIIQSSYKGGLVNNPIKAKREGELFYCYDINSSYPTQMYNHKIPIAVDFPDCPESKNNPIRSFIQPIKINLLEPVDTHLYCVRGLQWLDNTLYPTIPKKTPEGLALTLNHNEIDWIWGCELKLAQWTRKLKAGTVIKYIAFKADYAFKGFVQDLYHNRRREAKTKGDKASDTFFKLILNTLYGKFGQKIYDQDIIVPWDTLTGYYSKGFLKGVQPLTPDLFKITVDSGIYEKSIGGLVATASYITALARNHLNKTIYEISDRGTVLNVAYYDTDSIICNVPPERFPSGYLNASELGKWACEKKDITHYWAPGKKMYFLRCKDEHGNPVVITKCKGLQYGSLNEEDYETLVREGKLDRVNAGSKWMRHVGFVTKHDDTLKNIRIKDCRVFSSDGFSSTPNII